MSPLASYVFLAEFDIDVGPTLAKQFPLPIGVQELEQRIAELMLPEGVHDHTQDWTVFMLNQTPGNTISSVLGADSDDANAGPAPEDKPELLYVLNLVRTKLDTTVRRGGIVKAMAICTHHPFIEIFKPILLIALEDYFSDPSVDCLARLFDSVNAMDISMAPVLTRNEKIIMRVTEWKDVFREKFNQPSAPPSRSPANGTGEIVQSSQMSIASTQIDDTEYVHIGNGGIDYVNGHTPSPTEDYDHEANLTDEGDGTWVGVEDEAPVDDLQDSESETHHDTATANDVEWEEEGRISLDRSSISSSIAPDSSLGGHVAPSSDSHGAHNLRSVHDTHFFQTSIAYKGYVLPIKVPLSTFEGEVGDYSFIQLVQTFSSPTSLNPGPLHPHLHTNGSATHPMIVLFNALITEKRVIFLGHGKPAGQVAQFVLAASALGSGCGSVLRGFTERAFPYTNLSNNHILHDVPGYIAGVTNPIYETIPMWDVLCNIDTGKITIHKDIKIPSITSSASASTLGLVPRTGFITVVAEEEINKANPAQREGANAKADFTARPDNADNQFMDEIMTAIAYHYGEPMVRARFTEYVTRFIRLASRYEEDTFGSTSIGFSSTSYSDGQLGSGTMLDDSVRETSASRIEGWRRTASYDYYVQDFKTHLESRAIRGFDVAHQIWRLRNARNMSDGEAGLIISSITSAVQTYDQVVELLALLPPYSGGLLPITFGLFHQQESIRETTVDFLENLRQYHVGLLFLSSLNYFHRAAYIRLAQTRELHLASNSIGHQTMLAPPSIARTPSNLSSSSLVV